MADEGGVGYDMPTYLKVGLLSTFVIYLPAFVLLHKLASALLKEEGKEKERQNEKEVKTTKNEKERETEETQSAHRFATDLVRRFNLGNEGARVLAVQKTVNCVYHILSVVFIIWAQCNQYKWWTLALAHEFGDNLADLIYQSTYSKIKLDLLLHHIIVTSTGIFGIYYQKDGRLILFCSGLCTAVIHIGWFLTKTRIYKTKWFGFYTVFQLIVFFIGRCIITTQQVFMLYWTPKEWVEHFPFYTYLCFMAFVFVCLNFVWMKRMMGVGKHWFNYFNQRRL
jgi:hypothetical protein